jgi:hypothetical protein
VSYDTRQKKRTRERAVNTSRREHAETMKTRWYLTIVGRACACARCGGTLREDAEMIYRNEPRTTLCEPCADRDPDIRPRPSAKWEERERRRRGLAERRAADARLATTEDLF